MRLTRLGAVLLVALSAAAVGACGGDDGGGGGGGLSQVELEKQTAAACLSGREKVAAIAQPADISDPKQAETYLSAMVAVADEQVAALEALKPADDLKANYDAYLAAANDTRDWLRGVLGKARAKDPSGLQDLQKETETEAHNKALKAAATKAGLTGCAKDAPEPNHVIKVEYDPPQDKTEELAKTLLSVGGTDGVAAGFSKNFKFPVDLTIHAHSGAGSPYYDPATKTVNLFYGFVDQTGGILKEGQPDITEEEFGKQIAAVSSFILVHELGHAFVDVFEIPITGREEDAVDGLATVFFTDAVPNGLEYAFDAARFFKLLQDVQGSPDVMQFQDEHSLSIQRAFDIVCSVAGASEESLQEVAQLEILPPRRLERCPSEYAQKSKAWKTLLQPHLRAG